MAQTKPIPAPICPEPNIVTLVISFIFKIFKGKIYLIGISNILSSDDL